MMEDWQSWTAGAVVMLTLAIFVLRGIGRKATACCGTGCGPRTRASGRGGRAGSRQTQADPSARPPAG